MPEAHMLDTEAMSSLVYALVLMIMPVVGALLYAALQWVLLQWQQRRRQESIRRWSSDQQDDCKGSGVSAVVQCAAHVCALLLLSRRVVFVVRETLEAFMVFEYGSQGAAKAVACIVVIVGVALGILVVAVIRSPVFVWCVGFALDSVVRHHRPPFSPNAPTTTVATTQQRRLSSSVLLSMVMFVHAGLEGVVLGIVFRRAVCFATFMSVALHNVAEGLVVAVAVFGDLRMSPQERKVAESGEEDSGTLSLPKTHAPVSLLAAARHLWWQGVWDSSFATLWSHAGQAVAFLWVVLSQQPLVDTTTETATTVSTISTMEAFLTFASIGSMVITIVIEMARCLMSLMSAWRKSTTKVC